MSAGNARVMASTTGPDERNSASSVDAPDAEGTPTDATPLAQVMAAGERQGFTSTFDTVETDGGRIELRCDTCAAVSHPGALERVWTARLEGASDPADMLHVSALRCPNCRAGGIFVANYGPNADGPLQEVLRYLDPPREPPPAIG
jgi:hypothetical protein